MKAKYLILTGLLLIIQFNSIQSQFSFGYGIKTGLVLAHHNYSFDQFSSSSYNRPGFDGGIFIETSFGNTISLSGEMHFIQKGEAQDNWQSSINCLSVPILMKLKTHAGKFTPYLLLGPRFDFTLSYDKTVMEFENINKSNFGLTMGFGCEAKLWKKYSLLADIRYDYDFTGYNYFGEVSDYAANVYSRSLLFLVGIKF